MQACIRNTPTLAVVLALLLPLVAGAAVADTQRDQAGPVAVADGEAELTGELVERYLAAMRDMRDHARAIENDTDEPTSEEIQRFRDEQTAILAEHGFDRENWMSAHQRIFEAAMAIAMQREMADRDLDQELEAQRERIRGNPNLADEQKASMLEQLDEQAEMLRDMQDNPATEVVEPYYEEFREIFSEDM